MRVGIIEIIVDIPSTNTITRLYGEYFKKQQVSLMPQAVAVWCRQLGHEVHYCTYYGQSDPKRLLPSGLDVVFVATPTQCSALAYALAKLYRREKTLTVIGGPHARSYPLDCLRFFDLVVNDCDKNLLADILGGQFDPPALVGTGRKQLDFPGVEERMDFIKASAFTAGRPILSSMVPLLASVGCPYKCNFCIDANTDYVHLPADRLADDLSYLSQNWPRVVIAFHDPNFGVRFDETMTIMETVPEGRRNRYIMESSLSILKEARLERLRRTRCIYVAPGVESWSDFSNKAGTGLKQGQAKLAHVVDSFKMLRGYFSGLQGNLLFGTDADQGAEPVRLTKEFVSRLPFIWPSINIPTPFGGTPLFESFLSQGRILRSMPFGLYFTPYLSSVIKHYDPVEYYDHLIDIARSVVSVKNIARRILAKGSHAVRFIHALRAVPVREDLKEFRRIRANLVSDAGFRAFHEARSDVLPDFYRWRLQQRLGRYAELLTTEELVPVHQSEISAPGGDVQPIPSQRAEMLPQRAGAGNGSRQSSFSD